MAKITKELIDAALELSDGERSKLTEKENETFGLTSIRMKAFLNNICSTANTSYLEIGVYKGATLLSAMYNNPTCSAVGIENFQYDEREPKKQAAKDSIWENMRSQLKANIERYQGEYSNIDISKITIIENSFQNVDYKSLKVNPDVCFFDINPTSKEIYNQFFEKVLPCLNLNSVVIFSNYSNSTNVTDLEAAIEENADKFTVKHRTHRVSGGLSDSTKYYSGMLVLLITKKPNTGK